MFVVAPVALPAIATTAILTFIYDATPERAGRIFDLLAQIEKEKKDAPVKTQRKPR